MSEAHAFDYKAHVRKYVAVFIALMALTAITVAIGYQHFPIHVAVTLALVIATVKGSLVAAIFMHLIDEKRAIYWTLGLTVFFFAVLLSWPTLESASKVVIHR